MTKTNLRRGSSSDSCFRRPGNVRSSPVCPAKGGVHIVHTFVHARLFGPHIDLFLMVPAHPFMKFSVSDDMTLRLRSLVSLDVPGSAGTSLGYLRLAYDPSTESRCVGSGLFFRLRSWLVDPSWPVRVWTRGDLGVYGACSQWPRACWRARMTGNVQCITRRPWAHGVLSCKLRVVGRITEAEPLSGAAGFVMS